MPLDLDKAKRERLIEYLRRKGEKGLSSLRREELLKMAKRVQKKESAKRHKGGMPVPSSEEQQFIDAGVMAYNTGDLTAAPVDFNPPRQVKQEGGKRRKLRGGQQTSGATFLPAQWYDPKAPMPQPNDANAIESAYGRINAVSGSCQNLAAFPDSSGQQTGGRAGRPKKGTKKTTKKTDKKKPAKKEDKKKPAKKTTKKKDNSLWGKITGMF